MLNIRGRALPGLAVALSFALLFAALLPLIAQPVRRSRILQPVDETRRLVLRGNRHPLARPEFDRGRAPADLPMDRMLLVLRPGDPEDAALDRLLDEQQDRSSPQFHQWLTPEDFGARFGPADADILRITQWLESHFFRVERVSRGRGIIEFSGTARQVEAAFRTPIHEYVVDGEDHWANAADPEIPAALAPVVAGVASLHDFYSHPQSVQRPDMLQAAHRTGLRPELTFSSGTHALSPGDYGVLYNINPLYATGVNGAGSTIAVVGRTNINVQDVVDFRSQFGLSNNPPQIVLNGPDPGNLGGGEETEAVLDVSWASAVAPGSTVKLVVSKSTSTTDGVILSEDYIVDNNLADIVTESFGDCEAHYTSADAAALSALRKQAAAQGITFLVSSGDTGAAGCTFQSASSAALPLSVNILASSPYNVAVGGTQFNEHGSAQYWSASNGAGFLSALSPIPENVWNQSCAAATCGGGANVLSAGGGVSGFFGKPVWQTGVPGIPADGKRDVPDVSLTASAARDPYALCVRHSCQPNGQGQISLALIGGTSASTPAFAGMLALVRQSVNQRLGNANYVLYRLAAAQNYAQCDGSSITTTPVAACVFNDITSGNNAVPGQPGYGTGSAQYQSTAGYDAATGLGSVNATRMVQSWNSVSFAGTSTALTINPADLTVGASASIAVQVSAIGSGVPSGEIALITSTGLGLGAYTLSAGAVNTATTQLPAGNYTVRAHYGGDSLFAASDSPPFSVVVRAPAASLNPGSLTFASQAQGTTSAAQFIALTNTGNASLSLTGITITGTHPGDFAQTNTCAATLASGANCLVSVTFKPTATGARSASLRVTDTAAGSPHTAALSGTGAAALPAASLSPAGVSFGSQPVGTSTAAQNLTLSNTGAGTLTITSITILGTNPGDFARTTTCGATLAASATCTVSVIFTPIAIGSRSATVSVVDNAAGSPHAASLSGTGLAIPAAALSPAGWTFASQTPGTTSAAQSFTLSNAGSAPLSITSLGIAGANPADFTQTTTCGATLAAGAACTISATFTPTALGTRSASITVVDNAAGSPHAASLSGTGAGLPGASWYAAGGTWTNRKAITINHALVSGGANLANFPMLVSLTDTSLASVAKADGSDILFTASDGVSKLSHEVEQYAGASGQLAAWVRIPSLSPAVDKVIYLYYGNPAAAPQQSPASAWDNNYIAAWHLANGAAADSTGNANHGALSGLTSVAGRVGAAAGNFATNNYITIPAQTGLSALPAGNWTVEAWINPSSYVLFSGIAIFNNDGLVESKSNKFAILHGGNAVATSTAVVVPSTWTHVVGVYDTTNGPSIYINGVRDVGTLISDVNYGLANTYRMGKGYSSQWYAGAMDEVRVSNVARPAGWIATEYNNVAGTYLSVGALEGTAPTVPVTVTSAPAGLGLTVDSVSCTSPCTFQWATGTSHTIAAANQPGPAGVQYVFANWSDGLPASHSVLGPASPTTFTATFTTQYFLTTATSPAAGGTISPASGWYNAGSVVGVGATAAGGYQFSGFSGALGGTTTPQNLTMNAPVAVTANFTSLVSVTVASSPTGLTLAVDSVNCTAPCTFQWATGTSHTIAAANQPGATGVQYIFANWSDGLPASHSVPGPASPTTFTATFTTQYFLTTATSPAAGGTISPASGWYNAGSVVPVSAATASGYQFSGFSGALAGTSTPQNLTMNAPVTVTANFTSLVSVTVASSPAGLTLAVDSVNCTAPCTFQWATGTGHTIAAASQPGAAGVQYIFANWSDGLPASHSVPGPASPTTFTATFTTQYFLTTATSPAAGGTISPASGWYNAGSVITVSAAAASGYQFSGFSGAFSGTTTPQTLAITAPASITAGFAPTGGTTGWYSSGGTWSNRKEIVINHSQVSGASALANFPVLVSLSDANLQAVARADGNDILFTAADGVTRLNYEIERYTSAGGQLQAWVAVPALSPTADTTILLYYGNPSAASQQTPAAVWDSSYRGVWHLPNGTTLSAADSTGNAAPGTSNGVLATSGKIAGGANNPDGSHSITMAGANPGATVTVEAWVNPTGSSGNYQAITAHDRRNGLFYRGGSGKLDWYAGGSHVSTRSLNPGVWNHVVVTADGATYAFYINGVLDSTGTSAAMNNQLAYFFNDDAGECLIGMLDEVRISNTLRSAAWIATEFNNQNAPGTFLAAGPQQIHP